MRKNQKIITTLLWSFLVLTMVAVVGRGMWRTDSDPAARGVSAAYDARTGPGGLPILYDAPHFTLIDQDGKPFDSNELKERNGHKGSVWVAAFIFTNCPGVCPMMTTRMVRLQEAVPSSEVKLVSITVDPDRDTPEVLKQYAKRFQADESRWRFLTGDYAAIKQTADGMKLTIIAPKDNQAIDHDDHFLLIDRQGRVRGAYSGKEDDALNQLAKDAARLAEAKG